MFHIVLPNHPTVEAVEFAECKRAPPRIIPTFLDGLSPRKRWAGLHFRNSQSAVQGVVSRPCDGAPSERADREPDD
jgi:hypothetical protein